MSGGEQERYLLVDSKYAPLARAVLESPASGETWKILVLDGKADEVMEHEDIQMVSMRDGEPAMLGRIIRRRGDRIVVQAVQRLSEDLRQNLRMPVRFDSYIYPVTGRWSGRRPAHSYDLSCGGIAFFCEEPLERGERLEIVIPITEQPLVMHCEILRLLPSTGEAQLYAAKFVDLCEGEEKLIREAVFNIQLIREKDKINEAAGEDKTDEKYWG